MTKAWASMALTLESLVSELLEVARETLAAWSAASPDRVKVRNREIGRADPATPVIAGSERPYEGPDTMGSAVERHTEERDLPVVHERARELAAASISANTRRASEGALRYGA